MIIETFIILCGLCLFEVISSIDNAILNAHILKALPEKQKKFFLSWGTLLFIVATRGLLPILILWVANPFFSFSEIVSLIIHPTPEILGYIDTSQPLLLLGGGVYLALVFLQWLFLEEKKYTFFVEYFLHRQSTWFHIASSIFLVVVIGVSLKMNLVLALSATIGALLFFVLNDLKKNAEAKQNAILSLHTNVLHTVFYLEVINATFSIDGLIGAFAFTISTPLLFLGSGLGILLVRQLTIKGADFISQFAYLKNGAMYSMGMLSCLMVLESFVGFYPFWLAPLNTTIVLMLFMYLSVRELEMAHVFAK